MMVYALRAARDLGAEVSTVLTLCQKNIPHQTDYMKNQGLN